MRSGSRPRLRSTKERTSVTGPKISRVFFNQLPKGLQSAGNVDARSATLLPPLAHTPTSRAAVIKTPPPMRPGNHCTRKAGRVRAGKILLSRDHG